MVPASDFAMIFVYDEAARNKLLSMPGSNVIQDKLKVNSNMFFVPKNSADLTRR